MNLLLAAIAQRSPIGQFAALTNSYLDRVSSYAKVDATIYKSEELFLQTLDKQRSRTTPCLVLLDSRGKQLTSEQFAGWLGKERDEGRQTIVFAIGPADGWSGEARRRADLLLSLGAMTLPHELARVVLSEQLYRAFT